MQSTFIKMQSVFYRFHVRLGMLACCYMLLVQLLAAKSDALHIVTSTWWNAEWMEAVTSNTVTVHNIIPATADPHVYQLKPSDYRLLADADVIVLNGIGLESWANQVEQKLNKGQQLYYLSDLLNGVSSNIPPEDVQLIQYEHVHNGHTHVEQDMHIWLDPTLQWRAINGLLESLKAKHPEALTTESELRKIEKLCNELDSEIAKILQDREHKLLTGHNSFAYFARRYHLELVGNLVNSCDTHTHDPSARELAKLTSIVQQHQLKVIYTDAQINQRTLTRFAEQQQLAIKQLYSGTLDAAFLNTNEQHAPLALYTALLRHNAKVISEQ